MQNNVKNINCQIFFTPTEPSIERKRNFLGGRGLIFGPNPKKFLDEILLSFCASIVFIWSKLDGGKVEQRTMA